MNYKLLLVYAFGIIMAESDTAVIVVDVQGCFTQGGSLAVANTGLDYISKVAFAVKAFKFAGIPVYATQDWHPENHMSFAKNHPGMQPFQTIPLDPSKGFKHTTQMLWPAHCVQGTKEANILIDPRLFTAIVKKGTNTDYDSYSGFEDDNGQKTGLERLLKNAGIKKVIVFGIATDYCVKATAMDAKAAGFEVVLLNKLSRGVAPDTIAQALKEMEAAGITIVDGPVNYRKIDSLFTK